MKIRNSNTYTYVKFHLKAELSHIYNKNFHSISKLSLQGAKMEALLSGSRFCHYMLTIQFLQSLTLSKYLKFNQIPSSYLS